MLTKDLLRYDAKSGQIFPKFIDPEKSKLLTVASELIEIYKAAVGENNRNQLEEAVKPVIDAAPFSAIVARGLDKLLQDRTEFDTAPNAELMDFRQQIFSETAQLLREKPFASEADFRQQVAATIGQPSETIAGELYADLPDFQRVTHFKPYSVERLLLRYNVAQVQALLMRCSELTLKLSDSGAPEMRQLFKYLRFRQLLASIRKDDSGDFLITVDGPLNLFYKSQKYGMNLALFFPAVLHQPVWEVQAMIKINNRREYRLTLDQTSGLRPYSHQFLAYVPEEISMFQDVFSQKIADWQIEPAANFVPLPGDFYCFPDFNLRHESGREIALELFHPWHASHLLSRLQQVHDAEAPPLIIGVAKVLQKDSLVAETLAESVYFRNYGFVFREMPTAEQIRPVLAALLENNAFTAKKSRDQTKKRSPHVFRKTE